MRFPKNALISALIGAGLQACAARHRGLSAGLGVGAAMGVTPARVQPQMILSAGYRQTNWQLGIVVGGPFRVFTQVPGTPHPVTIEGIQVMVEGCRMWRFFHACGGASIGSRYAIIDEGPGSGWHDSAREPHATANGRVGTHFRIDRRPGEPGGAYLELGLALGLNITRTVITYEGRDIWTQPLGFGQVYLGFRFDIYP